MEFHRLLPSTPLSSIRSQKGPTSPARSADPVDYGSDRRRLSATLRPIPLSGRTRRPRAHPPRDTTTRQLRCADSSSQRPLRQRRLSPGAGCRRSRRGTPRLRVATRRDRRVRARASRPAARSDRRRRQPTAIYRHLRASALARDVVRPHPSGRGHHRGARPSLPMSDTARRHRDAGQRMAPWLRRRGRNRSGLRTPAPTISRSPGTVGPSRGGRNGEPGPPHDAYARLLRRDPSRHTGSRTRGPPRRWLADHRMRQSRPSRLMGGTPTRHAPRPCSRGARIHDRPTHRRRRLRSPAGGLHSTPARARPPGRENSSAAVIIAAERTVITAMSVGSPEFSRAQARRLSQRSPRRSAR